MRLKIVSLIAAVALISACSDDTKTGTGTGTGSGGGNTTTTENTIAPGSAQDFVVNVGDRVFFDYDSAALTSDGTAVLDRQATWLATYGSVTLNVEGHCDERGTREYNLALGEKRAKAVRDYLVSKGVAPSRLQTISYGKDNPTCTESDESCYSQNRRGVSAITGGAS